MKRIGIILATIILLVLPRMSSAQDNKEKTAQGPAETSMSFICTSTSDDSIQLKAVISVKHDKGPTFLANAPVKFTAKAGDSESEVGIAKTDFRGSAVLKVPAHNKFSRNAQQLIEFKAAFTGNEKFASANGEFAIKPSKMVVTFYEEDSVRHVKVTASQLNSDGTESPIGATDVTISVPKMLSMLKVASISVDSTGTGTAEFPRDIIGDSLGNLNVVATIDENDTYGNVMAKADIKWGLPKHLISPDRPSRELWTPVAPLWMIITLIIMLAGVWGHYLFAVIQLIMIKKSSKVKVEKEEATS
ncbi:MAG: hypothetical protein HXX13_11310 [Bacteroidetes bacterium]|nr:hypothetical protein [Bacteroidota bacterium]